MGAVKSTEKSRVERQLRINSDAACCEAARIIAESHVLLLCTGAGFSADSGLAVYADVAQVPAYERLGLTYKDMCNPQFLHEQPELFWGFWGQCYNDYRDTPPHEGYCIINTWAERWFRHSVAAESLRSSFRASQPSGEHANEPYIVTDHPGAFFAFTSNVDAHHYDWFQACEIRECHGNVELYQCAASRGACRFDSLLPLRQAGQDQLGICGDAVWRCPHNYRFDVDSKTMLAPGLNGTTQFTDGQSVNKDNREPKMSSAASSKQSSCKGSCFRPDRKKEAAAVGQTRGGGRPFPLRYMPNSAAMQNISYQEGFKGNHPICPSCEGPARPAIQMFSDYGWNDVPSQRRRWCTWIEIVGRLAEQMARKTSSLRVAILEIGCGSRVPTVRKNSEQQLRMLESRGAKVKLIRINPEMNDVLADLPEYQSMIPVLSIMAGALDSLRKIDAAMNIET